MREIEFDCKRIASITDLKDTGHVHIEQLSKHVIWMSINGQEYMIENPSGRGPALTMEEA